jgi:rhodanese-related sulfurtransferase
LRPLEAGAYTAGMTGPTGQRRRVDTLLLTFGFTLVIALAAAWCGAAAPSIAPTAAVPSAGAQPVAMPLTISVARTEQIRTGGGLVVDVREPSEWAAGHIFGAMLIPLGDLPARLSELPRNLTIVVVCHSGNRSAQGRDILLAAGFPSVTSMDGGMTAWLAANRPVVTGP